MRLTRRGEYGINGLLYFAKRGRDRVAYVREVSEALDMPESFLAKIFQAFVHSGILRSHRGIKGGYSLARPAHNITLREAIEAAQGPLAINKCLIERERPCDRHERCGLHHVLCATQRKLREELEGTTIGFLAEITRFRNLAKEGYAR